MEDGVQVLGSTPPKGSPPATPSPTPLSKQQQLKKNAQHTSPSPQSSPLHAASPSPSIKSPQNGITPMEVDHPPSSAPSTNGVTPSLEDTPIAPTTSSSSSPLESDTLVGLLRKQRKRSGPGIFFSWFCIGFILFFSSFYAYF